MEDIKIVKHYISESCNGEYCKICKTKATHKVEEVIFNDEPFPVINGFKMNRHPFTSYLCCDCFRMIMGNAVLCE